jgi:hypothetical protein
MKKTAACFLLALASIRAGAEIRFSGLDLAADPDPRLLFAAVSSYTSSDAGFRVPGARQLFAANTGDRSVNRLSACPEKLALLDGGKTLLAQSVYGIYTLPVTGGLPRAIPGFPAFTGSYAAPGQAESVAPSPDGRWFLFVEPSSYAFGDLVLVDSVTGVRHIAAVSMERPGGAFPAAWSADSRFFLYSRSGKLYYFLVNTAASPGDEALRFVGDGSVKSVYWAEDGFFYLRGSALYKVRGSDMVLKAPYSRFLDTGTLAGKIPFEFDPNFVAFWIAQDGSAMIFS